MKNLKFLISFYSFNLLAFNPMPNLQKINEINFSGDETGTKVCFNPAKVCRYDSDESSGGRSAYGDLKGSENTFVHYMKFKFYSNGYFKANPDGHIAFGLRGKRMRVEEHGNKAGVDGRGFIIGSIGYGYFYNKNNPTCVKNMSQIESFFRTAANENVSQFGNVILPETCSDTIFEDYKWYTIDLEVTKNNYIGYRVFNDQGDIIYSNFINDSLSPVPKNLATWFIGHVFDAEKTKWDFTLKNFEVKYYNGSSRFYPEKNYTSFLKINLANKNVTNDNSYSKNLNANTNLNLKVTGLKNRSRVYSCASYKTSLSDSESTNCFDANNYKEINQLNNEDWALKNGELLLKEGALKKYPGQYYKLYFRPNPMDEHNQVTFSFLLK